MGVAVVVVAVSIIVDAVGVVVALAVNDYVIDVVAAVVYLL